MKQIFDKCMKEAIKLGRPYMTKYDTEPTQQEWDLALIIFQHKLNTGITK